MAPEPAELRKTAARGKLPGAFVITNRNGRVLVAAITRISGN